MALYWKILGTVALVSVLAEGSSSRSIDTDPQVGKEGNAPETSDAQLL
jgi:hypothetical protein